MFCYTEENSVPVREFGVESQIEEVANTPDTERFTLEGETGDSLRLSRDVVVGPLVESKRTHNAVRAASRLSRKRDVELYGCDEPMR
jgi:hypothetical protein